MTVGYRPRVLGRWDGAALNECSVGVAAGVGDLVCKITDSYLGIGDRTFARGKDFRGGEEVHAALAADAQYAGRPAVVSELVRPTTKIKVSSDGFGAVHSLDILTMRTRDGVKVLSVVLWTDCTTWSSHSATAGYLVDADTEEVRSRPR